MRVVSVCLLFSCLFSTILLGTGTTGKITGTITDAKTGEKLIGVNVTIEGQPIGGSTNVDGYYVILNVQPGTYKVKASYIGYAPSIVENVRVSIDQTTAVDFAMTEAAISAQEIVIVATRPVVQRDVSASRANISAAEAANLPIAQVSSVIGLQAGVQGLTIRGGASDQTAFVVNGLTLRDERDNTPYTAISLLSVQDIQVQTGGFNAEYGNVRSGIINVVTKEGNPQKYNLGFYVRTSLPQRKYFGMAPNDFNSPWIRPYLDDAVAWTGTNNGAWDQWTRSQYATFAGWNAVAQKTLSDPDPNNHLTPEAAQQIFKWQRRKSFEVTKPDYDIDFGIGGPVIPDASLTEQLGNLRFYGAYRSSNTQYAIPLSRDAVSDYSYSLKLTSDIGPGMKLVVEGLGGVNRAVDANQTGAYGSFGSAASIANATDRVSYISARLFSTDYWAPNEVKRTNLGAKFTHVINPETFYDVSVQRFSSNYSTNPTTRGFDANGNPIWSRDLSRVYRFGNGYYLDEAPFGFAPNPATYSLNGIEGEMRMAVGFSNARDTSKLATTTLKIDFVTQPDRYNEIKAGIEYARTENEVNYGSVDYALPVGRTASRWTTSPQRFEVYIQDKLEFEGMVANIGVRYQLSYAGGEWYQYDSYTKVFKGALAYTIDTLNAPALGFFGKAPTAKVESWSPRLGIAFPITEDAKLFFNYGHFRSQPSPEDLYLARHETFSGDITRLANPNLPRPRTIQYELGFEYNLYDMFLFRLSGYGVIHKTKQHSGLLHNNEYFVRRHTRC
ncbi:MAG: TonB-dependent receptor [Bacteroidetes bacterium]|nr:TonB-dependent receptor [Bacteroidota bacterium]